jgi:multiple sugar transport system permease protein
VPYLLLGPAIVLELAVHVVPIALGIVSSFLRLNQFTIAHWTAAPSAGLSNYRTALDPGNPLGGDVYAALGRTAMFTVLVVGLSWCLGMFVAVLLQSPFRGRTVLQAYFVVPFALPAYASATGWRFMLGRDDGALNRLLVDDLHLFGSRPFWLSGGNAFFSMVVVAVWRMWPFAYLLLLAALQSVPSSRYEAAALDGAGTWATFRSVTLPGIRRVNAIVLTILALWSVNEFTVPYVLFGGDPPPSATLIATAIYRDAFSTFDVGVAAAANVSLAVLLAVLAVPYLRWTFGRARDV